MCRDAAEEIGKALERRGLADTAAPSLFTADELEDYYGADAGRTPRLLGSVFLQGDMPLIRTGPPPTAAVPQADFAGTNSRATSERSRRLGWRPRAGLGAFLASLDPEVGMIWEEEF